MANIDMIIEDAEKVKQLARVCFWGTEKQGKTHAALELATALVGDSKKIGVISSERGSSSLLAWKFPHKIINLAIDKGHNEIKNPFSPERYEAALDKFLDAGCQAVIVDSLTHVWEGSGGILDIVNGKGGEYQKGWDEGSPLYRKTLGRFLGAPCHLIVTLRSKDAYEMEDYTKANGKPGKRPVNIGSAPVIRKYFGYEMQFMIRMEEQTGHIQTSACQEVFPNGMEIHSITEQFVPPLVKWLDGAPPPERIPSFADSCKRGLETGAWTPKEMIPAISAVVGIPVTRDTAFSPDQLKLVAEAAERGPVTVGV